MTHPLRTHLEAVGTALRHPAMAERVHEAPTAALGPPATEAMVADLERDLGQALPAGVRTVLLRVSAKASFDWSLKRRTWLADEGYLASEALVRPPDAFMEWDRAPFPDGTPVPGASLGPSIWGGGLEFSLDTIRQAALGVPGWLDVYGEEGAGDDADLREHFGVLRAFMRRGVPVMTAPNGDWVAVEAETGRVLHVSHEGEEAGIVFDLDFTGFLTHLAWLGPIHPDFSELLAFSGETVAEAGDDRVRRAAFDAAGEKGTLWRDWFWTGTDLPAPDASLLRRLA